MAKTPDSIEMLLIRLEQQGEKVVRADLTRGVYGSRGIEREAVVEWLRAKAEERNEASSLEQISLARAANEAAERAAQRAATANTIATAALAVAIASMIIAWFR